MVRTGSVGHNDTNKKSRDSKRRRSETAVKWSVDLFCYAMPRPTTQQQQQMSCVATKPNQANCTLAFSGTTLTPMIIFKLLNRPHFFVALLLSFFFQNKFQTTNILFYLFLDILFNCFYCFSPLRLFSLSLFFERKNTSPFLLSVAVRLRGEAIRY